LTNPRIWNEINKHVATKSEANKLTIDQLQRQIHDYFFEGKKMSKYQRASKHLAKSYKDASREDIIDSAHVTVFTRITSKGRAFKYWMTRTPKGRFKRLVHKSEIPREK
jgi:predicted nuclease of restriction endonuclease-like (RecB) superfamily